eukprot:snap_masked-scaffold_18-processed-gene-5.35-mRNA-1 protein AED:1.00 eAED:1.00 QI:0/-1/0/0/-1/1/1/0/490
MKRKKRKGKRSNKVVDPSFVCIQQLNKIERNDHIELDKCISVEMKTLFFRNFQLLSPKLELEIAQKNNIANSKSGKLKESKEFLFQKKNMKNKKLKKRHSFRLKTISVMFSEPKLFLTKDKFTNYVAFLTRKLLLENSRLGYRKLLKSFIAQQQNIDSQSFLKKIYDPWNELLSIYAKPLDESIFCQSTQLEKKRELIYFNDLKRTRAILKIQKRNKHWFREAKTSQTMVAQFWRKRKHKLWMNSLNSLKKTPKKILRRFLKEKINLFRTRRHAGIIIRLVQKIKSAKQRNKTAGVIKTNYFGYKLITRFVLRKWKYIFISIKLNSVLERSINFTLRKWRSAILIQKLGRGYFVRADLENYKNIRVFNEKKRLVLENEFVKEKLEIREKIVRENLKRKKKWKKYLKDRYQNQIKKKEVFKKGLKKNIQVARMHLSFVLDSKTKRKLREDILKEELLVEDEIQRIHFREKYYPEDKWCHEYKSNELTNRIY